jgi:hypothetical protein
MEKHRVVSTEIVPLNGVGAQASFCANVPEVTNNIIPVNVVSIIIIFAEVLINILINIIPPLLHSNYERQRIINRKPTPRIRMIPQVNMRRVRRKKVRRMIQSMKRAIMPKIIQASSVICDSPE